MKKILIFFLFLYFNLHAAFDPGDILTATKRSMGLINLFKTRWEIMKNSKSISELIKDKNKDNEENENDGYENNGQNISKKDIREFYYYLNRGGYSKNVDLFFRYDYIPKFDVKTVFGDNQFDMNYITLSGMVKFDDLIKTDFFS